MNRDCYKARSVDSSHRMAKAGRHRVSSRPEELGSGSSRPEGRSEAGERELQLLADGPEAAFCDGNKRHVSKSAKSPIIALTRWDGSAGCSTRCCSDTSSVLLPGNGRDDVDAGVVSAAHVRRINVNSLSELKAPTYCRLGRR